MKKEKKEINKVCKKFLCKEGNIISYKYICQKGKREINGKCIPYLYRLGYFLEVQVHVH